MERLPEFTLTYDPNRQAWVLRRDGRHVTVSSFKTKRAALRGGVLGNAVGRDGGTVKIQMQDGRFQEQRIYPPRISAGRIAR